MSQAGPQHFGGVCGVRRDWGAGPIVCGCVGCGVIGEQDYRVWLCGVGLEGLPMARPRPTGVRVR